MLVAFCARGEGFDSQLDPRFGRCPFFILADSESGKVVEVISNDNSSASGGSGPQSAQMLAEKKVDAVLAGNVGPNAVTALKAAGIEIYRGGDETVGEAIKNFGLGKYEKIFDATVESHHGM